MSFMVNLQFLSLGMDELFNLLQDLWPQLDGVNLLLGWATTTT